MFQEMFAGDERSHQINGMIAQVFLGLTQIFLAAILFYRLYVLGQPDAQLNDLRLLLAFSIFGYIAARLFFGGIPTAIAVLMTATLRYAQGGIGATPGIVMLFTTAGVGLVWRYLRRRWYQNGHGWIELYLFSIVVHITMVATMLMLPIFGF